MSRTQVRVGIIVAAIAVVIGLAIFAVRSTRSTEASSHAPSGAPPAAGAARPSGDGRDAPYLDGKIIRFSDNFAQRAGIVGVVAKQRELLPIISVTGTVAFDPHRFAAVGVRISGRVRRVLKVVGDTVAANTILAEVESAETGRAEALVSGARAKELAAAADMKRERQLADSRVSSEREAEMANAHYESARAERLAAEHSVKALGGDVGGEIGILQLRSPIAGKVVSTKIARGQTVGPMDTVFEVADLSSVWVELDVFERDLMAVRVGDAVDISSPFYPDAILQGKVAHVGDVVDPVTRTSHVRVVVDNENNMLRPGQSVKARIKTSSSAGKVLVVPTAAVTHVDGNPTVFVLTNNAVEPRTVELGASDRESTGIVSGLKEGEQVVTDGLLAVKSELFR